MQRYEIERILSFDTGFDGIEWIERIGRAESRRVPLE